MTVPPTAWVVFNDSSQLPLVHFSFSSSCCLFLSHPAGHITGSHDDSEQCHSSNRGCWTEAQEHSVLWSKAFSLAAPPEDRCQDLC